MTRYLQGVQNVSGNNSTLNAENAQLIKKKKKKKISHSLRENNCLYLYFSKQTATSSYTKQGTLK